MPQLADFASSLLDAGLLLALAVVVGGLPWGLAVLRPRAWPAGHPAFARAFGVTAAAAVALAACQVAALALKAVVLADYLGDGALARFATTLQFRAGAARAILAVVVAGTVVRIARRPDAPGRWIAFGAALACLLVAGAWLVHGAARLEGRVPAMILTVAHQAAAAVWVGGVVQLVALSRLRARDPRVDAIWPDVVARFSRVAVASVAALVLAGVPLAVRYVGSWNGLVGTGYGSLLVTKVVLMAAALGLAAANFRSGRHAPRDRGDGVRRLLPVLAEAETVLLVALVFSAAALSSQPPAVDTPAEQATAAEVLEVFAPKWPTLRTPSLEEKRRGGSDPLAVVGWERTPTAFSWSNYSHNVAGLVLLPMALLALVAQRPRARRARHWPLGFVALAVFIILRSSASDGIWPFGDTSLLADDAEGFQHRLAGVLALALGLLEWRARTAARPARASYLFPLLAAAGGILLLTHAHAAFDVKGNYLVQVTHVAMGTLAVLLACGRWLELRLEPPASAAAGTAASVAMLLVALVLLFYREANVAVP